MNLPKISPASDAQKPNASLLQRIGKWWFESPAIEQRFKGPAMLPIAQVKFMSAPTSTWAIHSLRFQIILPINKEWILYQATFQSELSPVLKTRNEPVDAKPHFPLFFPHIALHRSSGSCIASDSPPAQKHLRPGSPPLWLCLNKCKYRIKVHTIIAVICIDMYLISILIQVPAAQLKCSCYDDRISDNDDQLRVLWTQLHQPEWRHESDNILDHKVIAHLKLCKSSACSCCKITCMINQTSWRLR